MPSINNQEIDMCKLNISTCKNKKSTYYKYTKYKEKDIIRNKSGSSLLVAAILNMFIIFVWANQLLYWWVDKFNIGDARAMAVYSSAICGLSSGVLWLIATRRPNDVGSNASAAGFTGAAVAFAMASSSPPDGASETVTYYFPCATRLGIILGCLYVTTIFIDEIVIWIKHYFPPMEKYTAKNQYYFHSKEEKSFFWPGL
ncbi:hypothetical protein [Methylobacterium indicum]|uniref:hypothetical protein n=1 Tax=Methylobacterium indicum TaxID=1775910 RepID=UPI000B1D1A0C|nr:hypothetical protein [Methylobacterium indicum]